jgi:hypothetical protein
MGRQVGIVTVIMTNDDDPYIFLSLLPSSLQLISSNVYTPVVNTITILKARL